MGTFLLKKIHIFRFIAFKLNLKINYSREIIYRERFRIIYKAILNKSIKNFGMLIFNSSSMGVNYQGFTICHWISLILRNLSYM